MNGFFSSLLSALVFVFIIAGMFAKKKKVSSAKAKPAGSRFASESAGNFSFKGRGRNRSQDRVDTELFKRGKTLEEHYRRQLDSFLRAGVIDRKEHQDIIRRWGI